MKKKYLKHRKQDRKRAAAAAVTAVCLIAAVGIIGGIAAKIQNKFPDTVPANETVEGAAGEETFEEFTDRLFASYVQADTLTRHYKVADPSAYNMEDGSVTWGEVSGEAFRNKINEDKQEYQTLLSFDYQALSEEEQLTYDVLKAYLEQGLKLEGMELYEEVLGEYSGVSSQLPVLLSEYAFYTENDVEEYLELCRQIPDYFEQLIQYENERMEAGLFMSDSNVDGVVEQCASFIENPEQNVLIETFSDRLGDLTDVSEEKKAQWTEEHAAIVKEAVIPAYEGLMEAMTAMKGTGITGSPASLPMGKDYYEVKAQMAVGTEESVEEMKTMVTDALFDQMADMQNLYDEDPSITAQVSAGAYPSGTAEALLNDLRQKISSDFPSIRDVSFQVTRVPVSLQDHLNPAFYLIPPIDHAWENVIYINESPEYDQSDLYLTLAHEGFPGHLYQNVYFSGQEAAPIRYLLSFPGYTEGWATYVENLAYDYIDTMENDVRDFVRANYFTSLGLYARMDIGVNYDGWTAEQLKEFIQTYFDVTDESMIQDIYDRMTNDPANYLSYYVGCLKFQELRQTAEEQWGESFSPMEFHRRVLEIGPAPFDVLETYLFMSEAS